MTETIHLGVKKIIGDGSALQRIELIPLMAQWYVPHQCLYSLISIECSERVSRLYVLEESIQQHRVLGICEKHHQELIDKYKEG